MALHRSRCKTYLSELRDIGLKDLLRYCARIVYPATGKPAGITVKITLIRIERVVGESPLNGNVG